MKEKDKELWFECLNDIATDTAVRIRDIAQEKGYEFNGMFTYYAGMMAAYADALGVHK